VACKWKRKEVFCKLLLWIVARASGGKETSQKFISLVMEGIT
jgi:hypothetical protein